MRGDEHTPGAPGCQHCNPTCGINRGQIYMAQEVVWRMRITEKTLAAWVEEGLKPAKRKTKQRFFLGDSIIDFLFGEG